MSPRHAAGGFVRPALLLMTGRKNSVVAVPYSRTWYDIAYLGHVPDAGPRLFVFRLECRILISSWRTKRHTTLSTSTCIEGSRVGPTRRMYSDAAPGLMCLTAAAVAAAMMLVLQPPRPRLLLLPLVSYADYMFVRVGPAPSVFTQHDT